MKLKKWEDKMKQKDLKYEAGKFDFQQYEAIRYVWYLSWYN